jgi:DNA-binding PadR family transcriptional regulator
MHSGPLYMFPPLVLHESKTYRMLQSTQITKLLNDLEQQNYLSSRKKKLEGRKNT